MRVILILFAALSVLFASVDATACSPLPGASTPPPTYYISTVHEARPGGPEPGTWLMSRGGDCGQDYEVHRRVSDRHETIAKPIQMLSLILLLLSLAAWFGAFVDWVQRRRNGSDPAAWVQHSNDPFLAMMFAIWISQILNRMEVPAQGYCEPHVLALHGFAIWVVFAVLAIAVRVELGRRGRPRRGAVAAAACVVLGMLAVTHVGLSPPTSGICHVATPRMQITF